MAPCPSCGYEQATGAWPCPQCGRVPDASRWGLAVKPAALGDSITAAEVGADGAESTTPASVPGIIAHATPAAEPAPVPEPVRSAVAPEQGPAPFTAATPRSAGPPARRTGPPVPPRGQPRSLEPRTGRKGADFLVGIGLGLLPLLIVSLTVAASSRLGSVSAAHVYGVGFALAALGWLVTILAMIVLLTRRRLRFIAYGLLTVIVALPVVGAALWMLILLTLMRG